MCPQHDNTSTKQRSDLALVQQQAKGVDVQVHSLSLQQGLQPTSNDMLLLSPQQQQPPLSINRHSRACCRVDAVQQALVSVTGISVSDQIVMCHGARLDPAKPLAAYKLPVVSDDEGVLACGGSRMIQR